jgi:hypothetical protein
LQSFIPPFAILQFGEISGEKLSINAKLTGCSDVSANSYFLLKP